MTSSKIGKRAEHCGENIFEMKIECAYPAKQQGRNYSIEEKRKDERGRTGIIMVNPSQKNNDSADA
jgi:ribosomal protein L37E